MRKPPTEYEQSMIKGKLIESCRILWERLGYKKTSVAEVASMAGISTGAFYSYFPSKEMLFSETANAFSRSLFEIIKSCKTESPSRAGLAFAAKRCCDELFENKWIFSLREDYYTILRKLPEGYIADDFKSDVIDITNAIELYKLTPKAPIDEIVAAFHTIFMSIYLTDIIGKAHKQALYLLIDAAVASFFEEI